MNIFSARKYPSQRNGQLSLEQTETRRLAYAIKTIASPSADFNTAAREMAALITGPCWLVPIPDSTGNTDANTRLASFIAGYMASAAGTAQVVKAIIRTQPIQSQCERHKLALGPIPLEQHHFARTRKALTLRQTYFVASSPPDSAGASAASSPPMPSSSAQSTFSTSSGRFGSCCNAGNVSSSRPHRL
jgi:hypothetical protein